MPPFGGKSDAGRSSGGDLQPVTPIIGSLRTQYPTHAPSATKIQLTILATALVDALGGPAEFHNRFSFPFIDTMQPNKTFGLPAGVWTDDTSMALCLAESLTTYQPSTQSSEKGGFDELHQLEIYNRWRNEGHLSAIGSCFDVGVTINQALDIFESSKPEEALDRIHRDLSNINFSGNGSLMRIVPIGLLYWRDEALAREYARRSSRATHPSPLCLEVCDMWTGAIVKIMAESTRAPNTSSKRFSKLDLLEYISSFPYTRISLKDALALPSRIPRAPEDGADREAWYWQHHPLLRLIADTQRRGEASPTKPNGFPYTIPPVKRLPSTGFVQDSAVAALYCFFATSTFEDGALLAVNLGYDADTVGAIFAGLAACWYAAEEDDGDGVFWTTRVKSWCEDLVRRDIVDKVAKDLAAMEDRFNT